ncbi:MAG: Gfo/Idh/MocA family oxidoreductase [Kiritimatiellae bacterium]|nr:Gfo/Idh/MocA family oxidoreductase [Kiritimatiellia bacterium]
MTIRIGIIGCGNISKSHVRGYTANGARVVAVTDVNAEAARARAEELDAARVFDGYKALIESGEVDAVSICSPPVAHEEAAVCALAHGIHVLCEKPLAHTVESGRRMVAAAAGSGALLMTAFRHRFLPAIQTLRSLLSGGCVGKPVFFFNTFCGPGFGMKDRWFSKKAIAGGGTLMDTSSHSVDMFRFLFGEVKAQQAVLCRHQPEIDVEDASVLSLQAQDGTIGTLRASWVAGDGVAMVEIIGQAGRLVYDYGQADTIRAKTRGAGEWESVPVDKRRGFEEEIAHFLGAIRGEHALSCTGQDGLRALEIVQACYEPHAV